MAGKRKRISLGDRYANPNIDRFVLKGDAIDNVEHLFESITSSKDNQPTGKLLGKDKETTIEQVENRAPEQAPGQAPGHVPEQVPEQVLEHLSTRTPEQAPEHVSTRASEQAPGHVSKWTPEHVSTWEREKIPEFDISLKPNNLNVNQYRILWEIYFIRPFKVKGLNRIGNLSGAPIPYGTVRNSLNSLVKKNYISKYFSINNGVQKGSTCQVNESKCVPLFGRSLIINNDQIKNKICGHLSTRAPEQAPGHLSTRASEQAPGHVESPYIVSKLVLKKLTNYLNESSFWNKEGIYLEDAVSWIKEFPKYDSERMLQQFQFAEAIIKSGKVKIKESASGWFYTGLSKEGFKRPTDFETQEEIAEREYLKFLEERKKRQEVLKQAKLEEEKLNTLDLFNKNLKNKNFISELVRQIKKDTFLSIRKKTALKEYEKTRKVTALLEKYLLTEFRKEQ